MSLPLHRQLHVSKTFCYCLSDLGRRRVLASEKRLRRQALRLGLKAHKRGWWAVIDPQEGTLAGRLSASDAAALLRSLTRTESAADEHKSAAIERVRQRVMTARTAT